jgi:hypothetical protein
MNADTEDSWKTSGLENVLWAVVLLGGFFALHLWILPQWGIHTCVGDTCPVAPDAVRETGSGIPGPGTCGVHAPGG